MTASSRTPVLFLKARDGVEIAYTVSGSGPMVVFVHATGFNKELAEPLIEETRRLGLEFAAMTIDQRGHGDSGVPEPPFDWWQIGEDIAELVDGSTPVVGVGHSSGGAVLVMAEILHPGLFQRFVLVEPILPPPPYVRYPDNQMSAAALRRRRVFPSRQAAFDNFMSKSAFTGWEERAMWAYVNGGLQPGPGGYELKCLPESEAEFFMAATVHAAWERLGEVQTPTVIISGEMSTTHQEPYLGELTRRFGDARSRVVPATSHFVWMERPDVVAAEIADAVGRLS